MNYILNVMIMWLLLQFLVHVQSNTKEVTIPVSSTIKLECDGGLRVYNIEVAIRRSNTSCWTAPEECTLSTKTIDSIKAECNKQVSCEVDIRYTTDYNNCLNEYGFVNVWYTCKKILDFSCDFESDLCNWSNEHDKNRFTWKHGNRLDYSYTPPVDHTSASKAGKYVYIYNEFRSNYGDKASLESEQIIAMDQQCLSFWFFTKNTRDSVYVYQNNKLLLDLSNYDRDKWHQKQTSLENSDNMYKLVFEVIRGPFSWYTDFGAIVIDDILIENQQCNSYVLNCDFESNSCDWNTDESNEYVWKKQNGRPSLYHTGPTTDHSTASDSGNYMYFRSTVDTIAYLEFQNVNLHVSGNYCLTFWYHMYHDVDYEVERLNVTFDNELVWTDYANKDDKWKKATIDLHNRNRKKISISFIGILRMNYWNDNDIDIAIDDIYIAEGTCEGLLYHEEMCEQIDDKTPQETHCPKEYLNIANSHLSFDPDKQECSKTYNLTKDRLLEECKKRGDSEKCLIDLSTEKRAHPECFQLYDFHIIHTCEDEGPTTVSSVITSKSFSSVAVKTTTSFTSSESSSAVSDETITAARVMGNSSDSETGLAVGLVIGALLLVCAVFGIIFLIRRHTFNSSPREKIGNNLKENDYIGGQDIALPLTANHSKHMQNTGMYNGSSDTSVHGHDSTNANDHIYNVQHEYTNVGAVNGFVDKNKVTVPTYVHHPDTTFADNHMHSDDEYAIVDPTAETSFNETMNNRTGAADSYMVLDPTQTGFNRQIFSDTPVGYEFEKPAKDSENKIGEDDQYAISDGVYDHSGNNRHKESDNNIYNHTVDTIYDSGSHKRNEEGREDTYDHFFGQTTEDDYDISTTT